MQGARHGNCNIFRRKNTSNLSEDHLEVSTRHDSVASLIVLKYSVSYN